MDIQVIYDPFHPDLIDCPIGCIRSEAVVVINPTLFNLLPRFDKTFWYYHEVGHIVLDTDNEFDADRYAFNQLVNTEFKSLKKMVRAVRNLLNDGTAEQQERKKEILKLAQIWDKTH